MGFEPTQLPPEQVSVWVQALASSHEMALFAFTQPVVALAEPLAGLQVSVVQTLLSLHAELFCVLLHTPDRPAHAVSNHARHHDHRRECSDAEQQGGHGGVPPCLAPGRLGIEHYQRAAPKFAR